ncbi:unnamed protein product [Candida parapsilosis]
MACRRADDSRLDHAQKHLSAAFRISMWKHGNDCVKLYHIFLQLSATHGSRKLKLSNVVRLENMSVEEELHQQAPLGWVKFKHDWQQTFTLW